MKRGKRDNLPDMTILLELLDHDNRRVKDQAESILCTHIAGMRDADDIELLLAMFGLYSSKITNQIATTLKQSAKPVITKIINDHYLRSLDNISDKCLALEILATVNDVNASKQLISIALNNYPNEVRIKAAELLSGYCVEEVVGRLAMGLCCDAHINEELKEVIIDTLIKQGKNNFLLVKNSLFKGIARTKGPEFHNSFRSAATIFAALGFPAWQNAVNGSGDLFEILVGLGDELSLELLIVMANSHHDDFEKALEALGRFADPRALEAIMESLIKDPKDRNSEKLKIIGSRPDSVQHLIRILGFFDDDEKNLPEGYWSVLSHAREMLADKNDPKITEELIKLLRNKDLSTNVKAEAMATLFVTTGPGVIYHSSCNITDRDLNKKFIKLFLEEFMQYKDTNYKYYYVDPRYFYHKNDKKLFIANCALNWILHYINPMAYDKIYRWNKITSRNSGLHFIPNMDDPCLFGLDSGYRNYLKDIRNSIFDAIETCADEICNQFRDNIVDVPVEEVISFLEKSLARNVLEGDKFKFRIEKVHPEIHRIRGRAILNELM